MKFKLLNETTNNYGDVIKVGDIVKYTTRTDNWLHESVRGTDCGEVVEIRKYDDGKVYIRVSHWKLNTISSLFPNQLEVKESRKEKEIVITKDKFQEFRKMILENLGIVLKIVFGNKCLTHRFDTKDYMDYEPKNVIKEEYAMNMIERDIHEVYNIMTKGYVSIMTGNQLEKKDLTEKYNVSTLVSTGSNTEEKTHTEIKTKDGKKEMVNVRVLEEKIEKGLLERFALESAKQSLEKIENRTTGVDTWVLENNEGTYGTEIVITKEGHIDLYLCIMEKYSSRVSYIRVGNFQPEFELGDVHLPNGKVKEYKKLGTIINALNKEYEQYGFYFTADMKNNRRMLADARKSYELYIEEEKENKRKENLIKDLVSLSGSTLAGLLKELGHEGEVTYTDIEKLERELVKFFEKSDKKYDCWQDVFADYKENYLEVERLKKNLVKKEQKLLSKEVTFDIDGEGKVEEIKDASYADANENYKRRRYQAPEKGNGYNKTYVTMKLDGKKFHDMVICLHGETEHHNLKDAILAQIKVLRKTWVEGDGVPYFKPEKNKEIIEKKYGSKEKLAIVLDAKEMVARSLGLDNPEPTPKAQLVEIGFERTVIRTFNSGDKVITPSGEIANVLHFATPEQMYLIHVEGKVECDLYKEEDLKKIEEVTIETHTEKMEEKEMNTINKNALNNRMVKLGEFLKENRDKDAVENKVLELFPKAMEVEVFEGDNVVYFLVGQDYIGKAPTKKEMKEQDSLFKEVIKVYGLSVHMSVDEEKIKMDASVGVDYKDVYGHYHYTDYTVKEMEIDCNPEPEKTDELEKYIKDHIHEVVDLIIRENHNVGYMYKKTVAVKRNDRYEITSLFEDMWTGKNVYIGNDSNMLMIPNSEKSFLTDIVEKFIGSYIGIGETVEKIKEKIKRKFEYSYSKSITVKEEEEIYVLETPSGVELFWYYKDAYSRMVELVNEMSEKFSNNYEVTMDDYSAKMETFSWKITTKKVK